MTKGKKRKVALFRQSGGSIHLFHFLLLSYGKYSAVLENRKRLLYYKSIFEKFVLQKMQMCTCIVTSLVEMYIF